VRSHLSPLKVSLCPVHCSQSATRPRALISDATQVNGLTSGPRPESAIIGHCRSGIEQPTTARRRACSVSTSDWSDCVLIDASNEMNVWLRLSLPREGRTRVQWFIERSTEGVARGDDSRCRSARQCFGRHR